VVGLERDFVGAFSGSELHIADGDGANAVRAQTPPPSPEIGDGQARRYEPITGAVPVWSPDSSMIAAPWSVSGCSGGPGCIPTGGIDVFKRDGSLVSSFLTPDTSPGQPLWSPDSRRIGYVSGDGTTAYAFASRSVDRRNDLVAVDLPRGVVVTAWTPADRLLVLGRPEETSAVVAYSIRSDGSDRRDVPGPVPPCAVDCQPGPATGWAPDGRRIAFASDNQGLVIRAVETGTDTNVSLPLQLFPWVWSPDATRLVLATPASELGQYVAYVVDADGNGLRSIGTVTAISWRPALQPSSN
jgi:Tol biopolymer transport system component